jgi:hypothetical protein
LRRWVPRNRLRYSPAACGARSPVSGISAMIPGEPLPREDDIELNEGRETASITFANSGDRPAQI